MSALPPPTRYLVLLDGQGSTASSLRSLLPLNLDDSSDAAALFVNACKSKFAECVNRLEDVAIERLVSRAGVKKEWLAKCILPYVGDEGKESEMENIIMRNPMFAVPNVYILQILRYLALYPSLSTLNKAGDATLDIVGFSSGILPALAISSSSAEGGVLEFVHIASEIFEVAFWVGYRAQMGRMRMMDDANLALDDPIRDVASSIAGTWSVVLFGIEQGEVEKKVQEFNGEKVTFYSLSIFGY